MKKLTESITGVNLVVALVAVNILLAWGGNWGVDLTRDKVHSLSAASKKIVREVDDVMNIKVFLTSDLPAEVKPAAVKLKTILGGIQKLNSNRIKIQYLDPNKDEKAKSEAENLGIQPLQFSSVKSDKFEISNGYFGLTMIYGDRQEVLPVAGDVGNLEYFLISGIKKLRTNKLPAVAIDEGSDEGQLQIFNKYVNQIYEVKPVSLGDTGPLPNEAETLLVIKTKNQTDKKAGEKIRAWLKDKKGLIVFEDKVAVNEGNSGTPLPDSAIDEILKENGIEIESKLVMDEVSGIANFRTASGVYPIRYPYWVLIRTENINRSVPAMSGISSLMLPWTSPIKLSNGAKGLFSSSQVTAIDDSLNNLSPMNKQFEPKTGEKAVLGAIRTEGVKLAVVGNARMLLDQYLANSPPNLSLALNLIDYFSQDESLLSIRGKALTVSPLRPTSESLKILIRALNIACPLVILTLMVIVSNFLRKRDNENA